MSWAASIPAYTESLLVRGMSPSTVRIRRTWLSHFQRFCGVRGLAGPTAVGPGQVQAYRASLRAGYALSTQAMSLTAVRSFFRWAVSTGRVFLDPCTDLVIPRVRAPGTLRLTPEQVAEVLVRPDVLTPVRVRNWAILETLYGTGVRLGECHALDLRDVNLRDGSLVVRNGKGRQSRMVPVGPHLLQVLDTYLKLGRRPLAGTSGEPALFVARGGWRLARKSIICLVEDAGQRTGLPRLGSHALRRACATHMLVAGADLGSVQQLLGHVRPDTTQTYVPLDWEQVKAEHARTHPRAR